MELKALEDTDNNIIHSLPSNIIPKLTTSLAKYINAEAAVKTF